MQAVQAHGRGGLGTGTPVAAHLITVGTGAAGWILALQRMRGMDMGPATPLGSLPYFLSVWIPMMAAMMVPGTGTAVGRMTRFSGRIILLPVQVAGYLAAWTIAGLAVHALYQPHTAPVAGALTLLAGAYELTPIKRRFREMTHQDAGSGWKLGFCCIGSSGGLMLVMLALGPMSITWMAVVGAVVLLQKLFRPWTPLDVGVAAAITILGLAALIVPSSVPGLVPPM